MIREKRINEVMDKFFTALKDQKDYKIESTGLTYFMTLDLIKAACEESIKKNPDKFENLCSDEFSKLIPLFKKVLDDGDIKKSEINEIYTFRPGLKTLANPMMHIYILVHFAKFSQSHQS